MPDPNSADADLLARLHALKKSSVSLDTTYNASIAPRLTEHLAPRPTDHLAPRPTDRLAPRPTDHLAERFARLGSASPASSPRPSRTASSNNVIAPGAPGYLEGVAQGVAGNTVEFNDEDEKSLEELLGELNGAVGERKEWDMDRKEQADVGRLLKDMRSMLPELQNNRPQDGQPRKKVGREGSGAGLTDWESVEFDVGSGSDANKKPTEDANKKPTEDANKKLTEDEEADDVIARIMAELEISKKYDPPSPPPPYSDHEPAPSTPENPGRDTADDASLTLPSAPTTLKPTDSLDETQALEDAFTARLAALARPHTDALGLPSAPSFAPSQKPLKVQSNLQSKLDEEIDTWCIICQDDATLKCLGCDGDLYCRTCWVEGHTGESAGFEERRHRAVEFVKGGDGKKNRVAAAG
ncbi:uncharacterized protein M421DRAFT_54187 [Didymella exigua CBS 183.55]|uniref:Abscission/NoCut checkpoint regulator n=1 Tax=Didymella exigua CBS 183.55 TaxID=1150837 RepID=A0A6A5RV31_9PLEO|nr:uncharacterized protein M421DRAFT_54187 [Didymella exigua CBS 183.55]KAF1932311.1 hypothetical protein M421DRAFT_54187 [Didymella exigua CBS 183.55]